MFCSLIEILKHHWTTKFTSSMKSVRLYLLFTYLLKETSWLQYEFRGSNKLRFSYQPGWSIFLIQPILPKSFYQTSSQWSTKPGGGGFNLIRNHGVYQLWNNYISHEYNHIIVLVCSVVPQVCKHWITMIYSASCELQVSFTDWHKLTWIGDNYFWPSWWHQRYVIWLNIRVNTTGFVLKYFQISQQSKIETRLGLRDTMSSTIRTICYPQLDNIGQFLWRFQHFYT